MSDHSIKVVNSVDHSQATIIFILGLLGVLMCQILAPIALFLGHKYRKECLEADEPMEGLGTAGWVLGIVGSVLLAITLLVLVLYCVIVFAGCVIYIVFFVIAFLAMAVAA